MSNFKDRLWRDLIREHGATLNEGAQPAKGPSWLRPRMLFGGGLAGVAGVGTAVAIALGTAGTSPAFAVTQNRDGSYTVQLWRASGIVGLNDRLARLGVPARAVQVSITCYDQHSAAGSGQAAVNWQVAQAKIKPGTIPKGHLLYLPTTSVHGQALMAAGRAANFVGVNSGGCHVPPCPAPRINFQSGGAGSGSSTTGTSTTGTGTSIGSTTTGSTTTGSTTTGTTTTGTTTTGTGTTATPGGGSGGHQVTMSLHGSPAQAPVGVLVPAPGCGVPETVKNGPAGASTVWTGTSTTGTGTSTSSTSTSTGAGSTTKAGS